MCSFRWFLVGVLLACGLGCAPAPSGPALAVTLTFDDGWAEDMAFASMLEKRGLRGTFYLISGYLGHNGYLTVAQAHALDGAGHEIGGHTLSHRHLPTLSSDEALVEICNDRANLLAYGFTPPRSFAYPYGETDPQVEALVAQCGYDSARILGPIGDQDAPKAETVPPPDPYSVRSPWSVLNVTTLDQMKKWVTDAERTGGWVQLIFHHLCQSANPCAEYGVTVADFEALLDWLVERKATVKLTRDVMDGSLKPLPTMRNPVMNPSVEGDGGVPEGWQRGGSGNNLAQWTTTTDAHSGLTAQRVDVSGYVSGSAQLVPTLNVFGLPGVPGHLFQPSVWYKSTAPPRWTMYYRDQNGAWTWWAQSRPLPAADTWTEATLTTPWLPAGATGLSFGLSLTGDGALTVDDFALTDLGQAPTSVAVFSPVTGGSVQGDVPITVSATSPLGISRVDVYAVGQLVGSATAPPYTVTWRSTTVGDGTVALSASALDGAGHLVQSAPAAVIVTNAAGLVNNPSLESDVAPPDDLPDCWARVGSGVNTALWTTTGDAHAGSSAQRVDISDYTSGAQRLVPAMGANSCAPAGLPGHRYRASGWYKSTASPRWVFYYRTSDGAWHWWLQSPPLAPAAAYAQATLETTALPADATAISFGLSLAQVGSLTVDDFTFFDLGP